MFNTKNGTKQRKLTVSDEKSPFLTGFLLAFGLYCGQYAIFVPSTTISMVDREHARIRAGAVRDGRLRHHGPCHWSQEARSCFAGPVDHNADRIRTGRSGG